jgi:uncharacterized protein (DUF736 family)
MRLGKFTQDAEGNFHGTLKAYGLPETPVIFSPQASQKGKPYFEIIADPANGAFDGGAAFPKQKGDMEYLSVTLESPLFPMPVNAGLFQDKANPQIYNLIWDRPAQRPALTAENTAAEQPAQADNAAPAKTSFFRRKPAMTP